MKGNVKWIQYSSFMAAGVAGNLMSSLIPYIRQDINMTYGQVGLLISAPCIGMLLVGLVGSYIMGKLGNKQFLLTGGIFLFLGFLGTLFSRNYLFLFSMNFLTIIGFGIYQVGVNTLCADYSAEEKGNDMNLLHFSYGLGAIASSILALICTSFFGIWRLSFAIALIPPIISIYFLIYFKEKEKITVSKTDIYLEKTELNPLKSIFIWILGVTTFVYLGVEISTSGWIPEFWNSMVKNSIIPPSLATGLFWAAMTFARLFTGKIADKIGLLKYILGGSIGTSIIAFTWFACPPGLWTLISVMIIGIFLAGLYPTIMAFATSAFPNNTGTVASFITVLASLGGISVPIFIGKISDSFGIGILSRCIFIFSLLFTVLNIILCLYKNYRYTNKLELNESNAL